MNKVRIYMSHPIRGKKRDKATIEDMQENNRKAIEMGRYLRNIFQNWLIYCDKLPLFPEVDIYVPADHDEVIIEMHKNGDLSESAILNADCNIVAKCDILLCYNHEDDIGHGMKIEKICAHENHLYTCEITDKGIDRELQILKGYCLLAAGKKRGVNDAGRKEIPKAE